MATLRINYIQVIMQANEINSLAERLQKQIDSITAMQSDIKSNWQGAASDEFSTGLAKFKAELLATKRKMSDLSVTIKTVANNIKNADEDMAAGAAALRS